VRGKRSVVPTSDTHGTVVVPHDAVEVLAGGGDVLPVGVPVDDPLTDEIGTSISWLPPIRGLRRPGPGRGTGVGGAGTSPENAHLIVRPEAAAPGSTPCVGFMICPTLAEWLNRRSASAIVGF
jgi:hypothetical protein